MNHLFFIPCFNIFKRILYLHIKFAYMYIILLLLLLTMLQISCLRIEICKLLNYFLKIFFKLLNFICFSFAKLHLFQNFKIKKVVFPIHLHTWIFALKGHCFILDFVVKYRSQTGLYTNLIFSTTEFKKITPMNRFPPLRSRNNTNYRCVLQKWCMWSVCHSVNI